MKCPNCHSEVGFALKVQSVTWYPLEFTSEHTAEVDYEDGESHRNGLDYDVIVCDNCNEEWTKEGIEVVAK